MVAIPYTLEEALNLRGFTIDAYEFDGTEITIDSGVIVVPPMILSKLTWHRPGDPSLGAAMYLDRLTPFHSAYAPVQLSLVLDAFRKRRLSYDTSDEWALAVRRWNNLHMGAMSTLAQRYRSIATALPLDTVDLKRTATVEGTSTSESTIDGTGGSSGTTQIDGTGSGSSTDTANTSDSSNSVAKGRDAQSEFPQGLIAGNLDYASGAVDRVSDGTVSGSGTTTANRTAASEDRQTGTTAASTEEHRSESDSSSESRSETAIESGRSGRSVMELLAEQREAFINVDQEFLEAMEPLFLSVLNLPESGQGGSAYMGQAWGW